MRERHAATAADVAARSEALSNALFAAAADLAGAAPGQGDHLHREALDLMRSSEIGMIADDLAGMREDVTLSAWDEKDKVQFECRTSTFASAIADAELLLEEVSPNIIAIAEDEAGFDDGTQLVIDDLRAWITGERPDLPTAGRRTLLIVGLVELLQLMLISADHRQRRRRGLEADC
jgi:hypothetical protein